ncbi:MAG TPA: zinc ribbon domain-containing protein [Myxococcales bacterium]|nr:zinc ribbon domain-containing protein [Myxococcales bacterium]
MPIYEFVCEACGRIVERLQKVSDPPPDACPECGGKMAKIMSRNSFQLKGGGWYKDLYSSGSSSSGGSSKPSSDASPAATPSPSTGGAAPSHAASSPAPSAPAAPAAPAKKD